MIVKFHARGRGGGSGPVDYLLGKDRNRAGASVLLGKPEEVRELIDSSPYVKKYTSGVLSFAEADLPHGQREKLMASFERVLLPGLDKDQYSVLWVEHQDKGRLELNFVIPNVELVTGKRLQPYFDRADRPRIDAWQTVVNGRLGLHDPNDPENRRALVTPNTLPKTKQAAAMAITDGLLRLCEAGELKTRQDVIDALASSGFEVVRTTKNSISLANPDGGQNIRLKGVLYEQSFNAGEGFRAEIEGAAKRYRADAESRIQRARAVCQQGTDLKREENQRRHSRAREGNVRGPAVEPAERAADGRPDLAHDNAGVPPVDCRQRERAVVAGDAYRGESGDDQRADANAGHAVGAEQRGATDDVRRIPAALRESEPRSGGIRPEFRVDDTVGEMSHDRTGTTLAERVRAATAGLFEKAGRMGERLRGMAEDVWSYATGERETERASQQLEQAGAEFERAAAPVVERLNDIERQHALELQQHRDHQRALQRQKTRELERSARQITYNGPTL
jgi:hypothetical protein